MPREYPGRVAGRLWKIIRPLLPAQCRRSVRPDHFRRCSWSLLARSWLSLFSAREVERRLPPPESFVCEPHLGSPVVCFCVSFTG